MDDADFVGDEAMMVASALPPLPFEYDETDERVAKILEQVSSFCGVKFPEVPENPDPEPETPAEEPKDPEEGEDKDDSGDQTDNKGDGLPDARKEADEPEPTEPEEPEPTPDPGDDVSEPEGPTEEELEALRKQYEEALEANKEAKATYWAKLWQVIRYLSNITCWTDSSDDTFFMQLRKQNYSAVQANGCRPNCCECDPAEISIPLDYAPYQCPPQFVSGWITVMVNGMPKREQISQEYLRTHFDPTTNTVHISRSDFPDSLLYRDKCCCLCRRKLTITLLYNAGYDSIPMALLPVICPLLKKIDEAKMGLSDCANAMTQVSGLLKSKKVGNIQYAWSDNNTDTQKTLALYTDLYNLASLTEVMAMSRCYIAELPEEMGDVV